MLIDRCALPDARPPTTTTGKIVVFEPIFFFPLRRRMEDLSGGMPPVTRGSKQ